MVQTMLKNSKHPTVCIFHFAFKIAAIIVYISRSYINRTHYICFDLSPAPI